MVLTHPFSCPVNVVEGHSFDDALGTLIGGRSWSIVTSGGWIDRGAVSALVDRCGQPETIIADVEANPKLSDVVRMTTALNGADVVVALGGGSVIDAAKGITAFRAIDSDTEILMAHLRDGEPLPSEMSPKPIIAIPTTSGTGSDALGNNLG